MIAAKAIKRVVKSKPDRTGPVQILWIANTLDQLDQARQAIDRVPDLTEVCVFVFSTPVSVPRSFAETCDLVVVDECHHAGASTWAGVISLCPNARWGFSATPDREDDLKELVYELLGPIVAEVNRSEIVDAGHLCKGTVLWHRLGPTNRLIGPAQEASEPIFEEMWKKIPAFLKGESEAREIARIQRMLADKLEPDSPALFGRIESLRPRAEAGEAKRKEIQGRAIGMALNDLYEKDSLLDAKIKEIIDRETEDGHVVLVICRTIVHCLRIVGEDGAVLSSKLGKKKRQELIRKMRDGEIPVVAATSIADEGLDIPRLDRLIMVSPSRSARLAEQRTGRALRSFANKPDGIIHDFVGEAHYILANQGKTRRRVYQSLGYSQQEAEGQC